jgi:hypothetical protein
MMRDAMGPLIDKATGQPVPRIQPTKSIEQKQLEELTRIADLRIVQVLDTLDNVVNRLDTLIALVTPKVPEARQGIPSAAAEQIATDVAESRRGPKGKRR